MELIGVAAQCRQGRLWRSLLLASAGLAAMGGPVFAVESTDQSGAAATVDEIVVTAQRREQLATDVPIAITALGGRDLERLGVDGATQIASIVPGLKITEIFGEGTNPNFFMRGVGLLDFGDIAETPVGFYQDDVYYASQASQAMQLFDVGRVEALKGPQGTLYGRNTTGGVINIVSAEPTGTYEGRAGVQLGRFGQRILEGVASGPLTDRVRGRVAVRSNTDDGWQRSVTTGLDDYGQTDTIAGRAKLAVDLSDTSELLLSVDYAKIDQKSPLYPLFGTLNADLTTQCSQATAATGVCFNQIGERLIDDPRLGLSEDPDPRTDIESYGASARLKATVGDFDLTSITAWRKLDKTFEDDADASSIAFLKGIYGLESRQFTQELRLAGSVAGLSEWVAGVYYFDEQRDSSTSGPQIASQLGLPFYGSLGDQKTKAGAVFGQVDWILPYQLTLTTGLRYSTEKKSIVVTAPGQFAATASSLKADKVTGRLALAWKPDASTLVYGSISTGFKAGGFNATFVSNPNSIRPVGEETITSYEVGLKRSLLDRRLRLNAATFLYDYKDIQAVSLDNTTSPPASRLQTLGDATIYGVDGDITWRPDERLTVSLGYGFLETELKSSQLGTSTFPPGVIPLDGQSLPMAPKASFNALVRYEAPMPGGSVLAIQADGDWKSRVNFTATGDTEPLERYRAFGVYNLRTSWASAGSKYLLELFVENIADEQYLVFRSNTDVDVATGAWGKPRTWGAKATVNF